MKIAEVWRYPVKSMLAEKLARIFHQFVRKIGQGFDWLKDFLIEWNNGVYFRNQKILQAIKD